MTYGTQAEAAHGDRPHGWRRWTYSTNHKDIGTMYLIFAIVGGVIGGILSMGIRSELMYPGMQIFGSSDVYNLFVSAHGLIMIPGSLRLAIVLKSLMLLHRLIRNGSSTFAKAGQMNMATMVHAATVT